jgi:hypothetical protein
MSTGIRDEAADIARFEGLTLPSVRRATPSRRRTIACRAATARGMYGGGSAAMFAGIPAWSRTTARSSCSISRRASRSLEERVAFRQTKTPTRVDTRRERTGGCRSAKPYNTGGPCIWAQRAPPPRARVIDKEKSTRPVTGRSRRREVPALRGPRLAPGPLADSEYGGATRRRRRCCVQRPCRS